MTDPQEHQHKRLNHPNMLVFVFFSFLPESAIKVIV